MKFFSKFVRRPFASSAKEKFKKIVEYKEVGHSDFLNDKSFFETLCFNLEKNNLKTFNENLDIFRKRAIKLNFEEVNKLFSLFSINKQNFNSFEKVNQYVFDNDIALNGLSYSFIISFFLRFKGFAHGYNYFIEAKFNQVKVDLNVYYSLLYYLEKTKFDMDSYEPTLAYIKENLVNEYGQETTKLLDKFFRNSSFDNIMRRSKPKDVVNTEHPTLETVTEQSSKKKSKPTPLYSETKDSEKSQSLTYKHFHKLNKKIKTRNDLTSPTEIDPSNLSQKRDSLKSLNKVLKHCQQMANELNLNERDKINAEELTDRHKDTITVLVETIDRNNSLTDLGIDPNVASGYLINNPLDTKIINRLIDILLLTIQSRILQEGQSSQGDDSDN